MRTILFVDDEINILYGLKRMLRSLRREYNMLFANSADEAIQFFESNQVDILVTDLRMPEHDGVYLLEQVRNRFPHTVRIVLSGYADRDITMRTIGLAHQFISKPAEPQKLTDALHRAATLHKIIDEPNLQNLVLKLTSLPSLPDLYYKIVAELNAPDTSTRRVGKIVSQDMGMTTRVLQLVNSSFFGLPNHVIDPVQATTLLGLETIRDLALSLHVFSQFNEDLLAEMGLMKLWDHSLLVAGFSKVILQDLVTDPRKRDIGFVLGLLHDLGKLVLAQNLSQPYKEILKRVRIDEDDLVALEIEAFGASHAEVGAYLLGIWGLDEPVLTTTAYHHNPEIYEGPYRNELAAVHIANYWANTLNQKAPTEDETGLSIDFLNSLGITSQLPVWKEKCRQFMLEGIRYA